MMTSIAGALLTVDLATTAADFRAGLGTLRALALCGQIGTDDQMHSGDINVGREDRIAQFNLANGRAFHIVKSSLSHCSILLAASLDRVADDQQAFVGTGHGALDQQQVAFSIHRHDFQVLNSHTIHAVMAAHVLVLEHAGRRGVRAQGTNAAMMEPCAIGPVC